MPFCDGVYLTQANEPAAGQDVFHFHVHVYPRWAGVDFATQQFGPPVADAERQATLERLRAALDVPYLLRRSLFAGSRRREVRSSAASRRIRRSLRRCRPSHLLRYTWLSMGAYPQLLILVQMRSPTQPARVGARELTIRAWEQGRKVFECRWRASAILHLLDLHCAAEGRTLLYSACSLAGQVIVPVASSAS